MGNAPDFTVILGTVWLATLGDYTCNEARGTLSFFNPGHRTRQKVTLTSRCQQSVRKQQDRLDVLESTTAEARAELQRAKRHGKECYRKIFSITDEGANKGITSRDHGRVPLPNILYTDIQLDHRGWNSRQPPGGLGHSP